MDRIVLAVLLGGTDTAMAYFAFMLIPHHHALGLSVLGLTMVATICHAATVSDVIIAVRRGARTELVSIPDRQAASLAEAGAVTSV
jgi:hypothetical protein